ncbi:uncharacterized protein N7459_004797 [Penicillium hispanicum]|uniref:uncharacterized protein n=1 Tax=Penicillium hispanicum TaxID=1080232 RepID=UPI002540ADD2|nr:uncharacterized protein N7459_004797 [Penicillium hispanicum]KAJ5584997.1 hypothetical protein N7459_004797 [Penicillium hispanicum]
MPRKTSQLDYDGELALPMPKPRFTRTDKQESPPATPEDNSKFPRSKKRAVTDPVVSHAGRTSSEPMSPFSLSSNDGKKMSKLELIKSKLSFKDLKKECSKDELPSRIPPLPTKETLKPSPRRVVTGSSLPSISPSSSRFKPKPKPSDEPSSPVPARVHAMPSGVVKNSATRIPLPPSATSVNVPGAINPLQSSNGSVGSTPPNATAGSDVPQKISEGSGLAFSTQGRHQPDIVVTRPSFEVASKKNRASTPTSPLPDYPVTDESPPRLRDLTEGEGRVKYLPRSWVIDTPSGSPAPKAKRPAPIAYKDRQAPMASLTDHLPSYEERLEEANMPLGQPVSPEIRNRPMPMQIDDIVEMVRSIQRQTDTGIGTITKKMEEVSTWIGDQLNNHIASISDLGRANSELFTKQCQISREMMKFQLDIRLDIGVMERRLNAFEGRLMDELQGEIRALARSYEELQQKTEVLMEKYSAGDNQSFLEEQRQRTAEMENEIAYLKARRDGSKSFSPLPVRHRNSISSNGSAEPLIKQVSPLSAPVHPASSPVDPLASRLVPPVMETKGKFTRSVSLTRKGLLKGIKDIASTSPDSKDKTTLAKTRSDEEKKWGMFGLRRRRDASDGSRSERQFPWASARRSKDVTPREDAASSRSSTPPLPSIPRAFTRFPVNPAPPQTEIQPGLRNMEDSGLVIEDTSVTTSPDPSTHSGRRTTPSQQKDGLNRGNVPSTTFCRTHSSSDGNNEHAAGVSSPEESFLSTVQEQQRQGQTTIHRADEESQKAPLLGDSEHEWDNVSLRESGPRNDSFGPN